MIRRPPRSTPKPSSAASDVYKRQVRNNPIKFVDIEGLQGWRVVILHAFALLTWSRGDPTPVEPRSDEPRPEEEARRRARRPRRDLGGERRPRPEPERLRHRVRHRGRSWRTEQLRRAAEHSRRIESQISRRVISRSYRCRLPRGRLYGCLLYTSPSPRD